MSLQDISRWEKHGRFAEYAWSGGDTGDKCLDFKKLI